MASFIQSFTFMLQKRLGWQLFVTKSTCSS